MNPYSWPIDAETIAVPILVAGYALTQRRWPASKHRRFAFACSQVLLLAAFATPLHTIAVRYLLSAHLFQNVVIAEWAPGLAVLGVAPSLARRLEELRAVRAVTHPLVALPIWLATYFVWHVPRIYDTALSHQHSLLHLEHATYLLAGVLLWWPVVQGRWPDGVKALYLFAAFVLASPLGLLLALISRPLYGFYAHAPRRLWGLSRLTDQQLAGLTMAAEQAVVFFAVFALYLLRFLRSEAIAGAWQSASPPLSSGPWTSPPRSRPAGSRRTSDGHSRSQSS
jgi:cytochrome c oxidase assembly factor CtaG